MSRRLLILNPESGSVRDDPRLLTTLQAHPTMDRVELVLSEGPEHTRTLGRQAREEERDVVLIGGGDGTIHHALNGLLEGLNPDALPPADFLPVVGVLPMGTGNDLARSLGFPLDPWKTLDAMDWTRFRAADLIHLEGAENSWCVNVVTGGLGSADADKNEEGKEWPGVLSYWRRGAEALVEEHPSYRVSLTWDEGEERTLDAQNVVVGNGRFVAGGVPVAPEARLDDGLLDLLVVPTLTATEMGALFPRLLMGKHSDHEAVLTRKVRRVRVQSSPDLDLSVDGEPDRIKEAAFHVAEGVFRVLVGPDTESAAFEG